MINEKLRTHGYALSAWKRWKKTMPEVQRREVDCPSTTDEPRRIYDVDRDRRLRSEQVSDVQLHKDWGKK